jgi:hypothetical protein
MTTTTNMHIPSFDPDTSEPFLLDLSAACPGRGMEAPRAFRADDTLLFERWAEEVAGFDGLVAFRRSARRVVQSIAWIEGPYGKTHNWVYCSCHRMLDDGEISSGEAVCVPADWSKTGVPTWVVASEALPDDLVERYQLHWGYGPILYEEAGP